jgi:hypothetical protein
VFDNLEPWTCPDCGNVGRAQTEWENDETHMIEGTFRHSTPAAGKRCKEGVALHKERCVKRDPALVTRYQHLRLGVAVVWTADGLRHFVQTAGDPWARQMVRATGGASFEGPTRLLDVFRADNVLLSEYTPCAPPPPDFDFKEFDGWRANPEPKLQAVLGWLQENWHDAATMHRLVEVRFALRQEIAKTERDEAISKEAKP